MLLTSLGWALVRRRRAVLALTGLCLVVAGLLGGGVVGSLTTGGFVDPDAESERARLLLLEQFEEGPPNLVVLVTARNGTVDAPEVVAEGTRLTRELAARPGIEQVWSYWSAGPASPLRSSDGRQGLVLARIGGDDDAVLHSVEELGPDLAPSGTAVTLAVGGTAEINRQAQEQIRQDLEKAELLSLPVLLLLLVLIFGSVVAAALPLAIGVVAVLGTLLVLRGLTAVTDVSVFALNLTTALGLGLAIDYSLFVVARYREERAAGLPHADGVVRAVQTAGRTVLFSAATVAASLSALMVFPTVFLRSFAYAGIAVVVLSAAAALILLPALLAVVGPRIDRWVVRVVPAREGRHREAGPGSWHRLAVWVMRRPVLAGGSVLALLLFLGLPALGVTSGLPDHRVLPSDASSRQVQEAIDRGFARGEATGMIVITEPGSPVPSAADAEQYATALSRLAGVARVDAATGSYAEGSRVAEPVDLGSAFVNPDGTWLSVVPAVEALSPEGERLVEAVRALPSPAPVLVGGASASLVDTKDALYDRLPLALGLIGLVTFVVLFLFTGGVLVGLKGLVLNLLSLTATFGAMVWVFQDGNLSGPLDFTATGTLDTNTPILLFCVAFGLSMDYEVFLLSRIKERYDATGDNRAAVAAGLERTGRLVTAAAVLLAVVFLAFATSGITFIKLLGIGTALAVVMDATLVRGILVPAFMRLAGDANWWAPRPLRAVHERFGLREPVAARIPRQADAPDAGLERRQFAAAGRPER